MDVAGICVETHIWRMHPFLGRLGAEVEDGVAGHVAGARVRPAAFARSCSLLAHYGSAGSSVGPVWFRWAYLRGGPMPVRS